MPYILTANWPMHALTVRPIHADRLRCLEPEVIG